MRIKFTIFVVLFSLDYTDGTPKPSSLLSSEIYQKRISGSGISKGGLINQLKHGKNPPRREPSFSEKQIVQKKYRFLQSETLSETSSEILSETSSSTNFYHLRTNIQDEVHLTEVVIQRQKQSPHALDRIIHHLERIRRRSPTVWIVSLACIVVHILWQIPICRGTLSRHFVVSRANARSRPQSLLLNSISHSSSWHLMTNLLIYSSLGPQLQHTLQQKHEQNNKKGRNWLFWSLLVGASVAGSCLHLLKEKVNGCMGLSTITLSMVSLHANIFPEKVEAISRYILPMRASTVVNILIAASALGCIYQNDNSCTAHSAHLGGLLFGIGYYQVWLWGPLLFSKTFQRRYSHNTHESVLRPV